MSDPAQAGTLKRAREGGTGAANLANLSRPSAELHESSMGSGSSGGRRQSAVNEVKRPASPPPPATAFSRTSGTQPVRRMDEQPSAAGSASPSQHLAGADKKSVEVDALGRSTTANGITGASTKISGSPARGDGKAYGWTTLVTTPRILNGVLKEDDRRIESRENLTGKSAANPKIVLNDERRRGLTANGDDNTAGPSTHADAICAPGNGVEAGAESGRGALASSRPVGAPDSSGTRDPPAALKWRSDATASCAASSDGASRDDGSDDVAKVKRRKRSNRSPVPLASLAPPITEVESRDAPMLDNLMKPAVVGAAIGTVRAGHGELPAGNGRQSPRSLLKPAATASASLPAEALGKALLAGQARVKKRGRPPTKENPASGVPVASPPGVGSAGSGRGAGRGGRGRSAWRGRGRGRGRRRGSLLDHVGSRGPSNKPRDMLRWRTHRMVEDYVNTCGNIMYPRVTVGPFGYKPEEGQFPLERPSTLGLLTTQLRRPTVIEKWSPYQVALFEAAISKHGKVFHLVAREIDGKSVADTIEFYYMWKKTNHYKQWKAMWRSEQAILQPPQNSSDEEEVGEDSVSVSSGSVDVLRVDKGKRNWQQRS